jgi:NADH:ubiquinone oxidoreductase subunit K
VGEGMLGMIAPMITLGLLWLATATEVGTTVRDTPATLVLAGFLRKLGGWNTITAAMLFAIGSTIFSWLLLRGRMIPRLLAWLGVAASVLLVVLLPLELAGAVSGPVTKIMWLPMAAFEIPLGLWLLTKGVAPPARRQSS